MKTTVRSIFILVFFVMSTAAGAAAGAPGFTRGSTSAAKARPLTACLALADFGSGINSDDPNYPEDTEYAKSAVAGQRSQIYDLGMELERQATALAKESFEHFRGWNGTISDEEQAILFKSEAFAASCRLFLKLTEAQSDFFRSDNLRTNLSNAFTYLANAFNELEQEMRRGNVMPFVLSDCRRILSRLEREFASWPDADNLAYLDHKYVKARDAAVYLIERTGIGQYIRRPFKNLESVFRYNYDRKQDKNPWKYLVEVSYETLDKMRKGPLIDLTFEGLMILEQSNRKDRAIYLIEHHKKRALARVELVQKFGGWGKAFEVPREVIDGYEDGEPIR